jgi:hypothetical protein
MATMGQTYPLLLPAAALLAIATYAAYTRIWLPTHLPRVAPGPDSAHWFFGNVRVGEPSELFPRLRAEYGRVVSLFDVGHVRPPSRPLPRAR